METLATFFKQDTVQKSATSVSMREEVKDSRTRATLEGMGILDEYERLLYIIKNDSDLQARHRAIARLKSLKEVVEFSKAVADVAKRTETSGDGDRVDEIKITMLYEVKEKDIPL